MTHDIKKLEGIQYREMGPAAAPGVPTFLLLHGLGGSLFQWNEVQQRTASTWRTVAVDIPGFGQQAERRWDFTVASAADQLAKFSTSLGLTNCTLISHSVGGVVGGLLASKVPELFPRVVFASGALYRASAIAQNPLRAFLTPRLGLAVGAQFFSGMIPVPDVARHLLARSSFARQVALWPFVAHPSKLDGDALSESLIGTGSCAVLKILITASSIDYVRIIDSVTQPVALIWGDEDRLINDDDVSKMGSAVNLVLKRQIKHCGHWPMLEAPDTFIDILELWERDAAPDDHRDGGI